MHDTPLSSLSLRIGEPYWLLHQGNCEHFIVVDQIRYVSTPENSYPIDLLLQNAASVGPNIRLSSDPSDHASIARLLPRLH
jgi:hypothetical protein